MKNTMIPQNIRSVAGFTERFKDEETCLLHFEKIRFRKGEYCPHCGHKKIYRFQNGKRYRCAKCRQDFTIKTGTVFGESKVSMRKWFIAIYLLTSNKKGVSSVQLAKQVGVTQKTAWFMDHRIREAMKDGSGMLFGDVEVDETYIGGKERNKHFAKRVEGTQGRNIKTKTPVIGLLQRKGNVKASVLNDVRMITIEKHIVDKVKIGSQLFTDDFISYGRIGKLYPHESVQHGRGEYVRGKVHTNSVEGFWAAFKRSYYGIYHHMSRKHLQRYFDEVSYRFNGRLTEFETMFDHLVRQVSQAKRLPYKLLTQAAA